VGTMNLQGLVDVHSIPDLAVKRLECVVAKVHFVTRHIHDEYQFTEHSRIYLSCRVWRLSSYDSRLGHRHMGSSQTI
jgi:macrodomain Ter protein organizer (MatP/YcbG family)